MRQKIALTKANLKRAERDQAVAAKKAADEKRQSTSTSDAGTDAGEDIDTKTESYKVNLNLFRSLMNSYKHLPDDASIEVIPLDDRMKLKQYMKAINVNMNTKLLSTLRTNL